MPLPRRMHREPHTPPSFDLAKRKSAAQVARRSAEPGVGVVLHLGLFVRVDYISGLVVAWRQDGLIVHAPPRLEPGAGLDVVILHLQHAGLVPFAALAELH